LIQPFFAAGKLHLALSLRRSRDISLKAKTVTVGIRGTDLWGKSTGDRDLVCLLEGKITVGAEGHPQMTLDQPFDYYQKPCDAAPSVARVDPGTLAQWAAETELSADGAGRARKGAGVSSPRSASSATRRWS
jgi:hypothetical protein